MSHVLWVVLSHKSRVCPRVSRHACPPSYLGCQQCVCFAFSLLFVTLLVLHQQLLVSPGLVWLWRDTIAD